MNGCATCGGFSRHHDPIAHDWWTEWVPCPACAGERTVRRGQFEIDCPVCDGNGGWEP